MVVHLHGRPASRPRALDHQPQQLLLPLLQHPQHQGLLQPQVLLVVHLRRHPAAG